MKNSNEPSKLSRRQALARLGLVAGAAYAAPVLMQLNTAHASPGSGGSGSGGGGGRGSGHAGGSGRSGRSSWRRYGWRRRRRGGNSWS